MRSNGAATELPRLEDGQLEPVSAIVLRLFGRKQNPSTTWRWVRKGGLPAVQAFGSWQTTEACVRAWLEQRSRASPTKPVEPHGPTDDELRSRGLLS